MTVKLDLIEDASVRRRDFGLEVIRNAFVSGLTGDAATRMFNAMNESGVPQYLDPHPTIGGIRVEDVYVTSMSHDKAKVVLTYRTPNASGGGGVSPPPQVGDLPQLTVGATIVQIETQKDRDGNDFELTYTDRIADYDADDPDKPTVDTDTPVVGTATKYVPQVIARKRRAENASPLDNALLYVGKTNASEFLGKPAGTWLCTELIGNSNDNGATFVVDYGFQFAENVGLDGTTNIGWDVVLRAERDGKPQPEPVVDVNIKEFKNYKTEEFNDLGL